MYSNQDLIELVDILRSEKTETELLEFKSDFVSNYVNIYNDTSARVIGNSATRTEVQR